MPLPEASDALPVGTVVGDFEIKEVIGVGGFGIVYRAWEHSLERDVALKEYMPTSLVGRGAGGHLNLRSHSYEEDYALGLRSFRNEARLLARFDHPSLVKVHRFLEANGTAYMAMPFYKARTLRQRRQELGAQPITQAWLMLVIEPLLGALAEMHRAEVYHRDIAPDNILWCEDSRPVLLDFGAARRVLTDRTQHLTAVLKPQFAPIEQYAESKSMRQGPWTDIFALASTCYFMLTGRPPLPATARVLSDDLTPLAQVAPAGFDAHVLNALDWAMAVLPQDRPQSAGDLWDALQARREVPQRFVASRRPRNRADVATGDYKTTVPMSKRARRSTDRGVAPAGATAQKGRREQRSVAATAKRFRWTLLAITISASASYAWFEHGNMARESADLSAYHGPSDGQSPASSATRPSDATSPPEQIANEQANAQAQAPAPVARASSPSPGGSPGPRELCLANKSSNVEECVRRVCKTEPRFRRNAICLRQQRQSEPWWRFFKSG
jgi:serine/threonine protein kinase